MATTRTVKSKVTPIAAAIPREQPTLEAAYAKMSEGLDETLAAIKAPGWMRSVMSMLTAFCVGYGIGWLLGMALEAVVLSSLAFSGSTTLAVLVWIVGVMLIIVATMKLVPMVGMAIYTGDVDRWVAAKYRGAKDLVLGFIGLDGQAEHAEAHYAAGDRHA